jgi:hypothetical protein
MNTNRAPVKIYKRVPGGEKPCALCEIAADQVYFTDDLLPLHDNCMCDIEEDDGEAFDADKLSKHHLGFVETLLNTGDQQKTIGDLADHDAPPEAYHNLVAVRQHGELGPVLTWKHQKFTAPSDLPIPLPPRPPPSAPQGFAHQQRMQENVARVAQYRRAKAAKTFGAAKPKPKVKLGELGRVDATVGPGGNVTLGDVIPFPTRATGPSMQEWMTDYRAAATEAKMPASQQVKLLDRKPMPWTEAQWKAEDNPKLSREQRAVARNLAEDIYQSGAQVEPGITAATRAAVEKQGGHMSGLDHRLKDGPSLYRKIQATYLDEHLPSLQVAAANIKDSVRYTAVFSAEGAWESGNKLRKALESLGAKTVKDPIGVPLNGYRGRNMAFTMNGVPFEMQTNTELGLGIKAINHEIYDVARKLSDDDPKVKEYDDEMQHNWDAIPITKGTPVVQTEKDAKGKDLSKVLYTAKDTKYRGRTVPGGEADIGSPEMLRRERLPSNDYGMTYSEYSEAEVERARAVPQEDWDKLPIQMLPNAARFPTLPETPIIANEPVLKKKSIDKVVSGEEPFREGYVVKLWRDDDGNLHVVDGHHRVAMYHALGKDMPVRIMDEDSLKAVTAESSARHY